jgi:hypothetical protein
MPPKIVVPEECAFQVKITGFRLLFLLDRANKNVKNNSHAGRIHFLKLNAAAESIKWMLSPTLPLNKMRMRP